MRVGLAEGTGPKRLSALKNDNNLDRFRLRSEVSHGQGTARLLFTQTAPAGSPCQGKESVTIWLLESQAWARNHNSACLGDAPCLPSGSR